MLLIAVFALACAILTPIFQFEHPDRTGAVLLTGLVSFVVFVVSFQVLLRPHPTRDWLVWILVCLPPGLCLFLLDVLFVCATVFFMARRDWTVVFLAADGSLCSLFLSGLLIRSLIPKRCPNCRHHWLLRDRAGDRDLMFAVPPRKAYWCRSCGGRFCYWPKRPWEPIP